MKKYEILILTFFTFTLVTSTSSDLLAQDVSQRKYELFKNKPFANLFIRTKNLVDHAIDDTLNIKKRFWRASAELMLVQILPWAYNYYVRDAEFAHITWESIWYNMHFKNWEWDDNTFKTNQYAHPFQGNLYFSSFRTNGYNFWQSAPAALAGSYLWEVAAETHPPAPNDLINTTLGGISLGEMTFRFSNLIVNNRQTGFKRQINEVLAFIVNPMNGFNRILDGRWGKVMPNAPDRVPDFLTGNLDVGYRRINNDIDNVFSKGKLEFFVRANIQYGNPFEDFEKPFSNFSMMGELAAADSAKLNVQVNGFLFGRELKNNDKVNHVFALTMNYDYLNNNPIQYGAQSFNFKVLSNFIYKNNTNINAEIGFIGVVLAAVPDDYLYYGEGRNYDFGPGAGFLYNLKFDLRDKLWLSFNYKGIWFKTVNGNESHFFLNSILIDLRYYLTRQISVAVQRGYFVQNSFYADYDETVKKYPYGRITIGCQIGSK